MSIHTEAYSFKLLLTTVMSKHRDKQLQYSLHRDIHVHYRYNTGTTYFSQDIKTHNYNTDAADFSHMLLRSKTGTSDIRLLYMYYIL